MFVNKPTLRQRLRYSAGGILPADLQQWVRHDLAGPGAGPRYLARFLVPMIPLLLLFLLFPGPNWLAVLMMLLIFVPVVYFAMALHLVYREFRLRQHGIDPVSVSRHMPGVQVDRSTYEANYRRP